MHIVQLEKGVWLAEGLGDPCRTNIKQNAKTFVDFVQAKQALVVARKYRQFLNAVIEIQDGVAICQISGMTEERSAEISRAMAESLRTTDYTNMKLIKA